MTDEEFIFRQTERERKRDGRGTFNKKRQGGKVVRLPSDGMTKREWEKMNGEVKTYDFSKLMSWAEFRKIPHDIQQQYLDSIADRFNGIMGAVIAEGMGTTHGAFAQYIYNKKLSVKNSVGKKASNFYASDEGRRWLAWKDGTPFEEKMDEPMVIDTPTVSEIIDKVAKEPSAEPTPAEKKTASIKQADINNVAMILNALAGTGAKLTIEITL